MITVKIESDVEGVFPIELVTPPGMYRNNGWADTSQDSFIHDVNVAIAEVFCTERNKQRAPIE